jgi:hypothetical protein
MSPRAIRLRRYLLIALLCALLLAPPLLLAGALARGAGELQLRAPWAGGAAYVLTTQPCEADAPGRVVLWQRPQYYVLARGRELLSLPIAPRCP